MPESGVMALMRRTARESGCDYKREFAQAPVCAYVHRTAPLGETIQGLCRGVSLYWLKREAKYGKNTLLEDLGRDITRDGAGPRIQKLRYLQGAFQNLDNYAGLISRRRALGLSPKRSPEDRAAVKQDGFRVTRREDIQRLVSWATAATRTRYFLLTTGIHSMAMSGGRFGKLKFFDPNCGVVSTNDPKKMADFLYEFLNETEPYFEGMLSPTVGAYKFSRGSILP